mgnify:FL=1
MTSLDRNSKILIIALVFFVVAVISIMSYQAWKNKNVEKEKISRGIDYLTSLENRDVASISEQIDRIKASQTMEQLEADENAVWKAFDMAMILGDSRAVGFRFYEFLMDAQVIAESGRKITDVPDDMDKIKSISPKQIFLCFGLNDIKSGLWPEPEDYAAAYKEIVMYLNQELPGTTIFINSILPATGAGYASFEGYARIPEYNAALQEMAQENGYKFIDNSTVAYEYADLYEQDGLHLQKDFYQHWAASMIMGGMKQ